MNSFSILNYNCNYLYGLRTYNLTVPTIPLLTSYLIAASGVHGEGSYDISWRGGFGRGSAMLCEYRNIKPHSPGICESGNIRIKTHIRLLRYNWGSIKPLRP